jgi:Rrf2 family cysteine metabolism transcriptional repressor
MKISAKGDYACRAMLELALNYDTNQPVQLSEIVQNQGIPDKYLVQILVVLKGAGFVKSKRGAEGGYLLTRPPADITLGQVVRAVEGPLLTLKCSNEDDTSTCPRIPICEFHPIWEEIRGTLSNILGNITFEDICRRSPRFKHMYYI